MPTQYTNVLITTTPEEAARIVECEDAEQARLAEKRSRYPRPKLYKVIDLKDFGASRQIRFGHLMGGDDWYFVMAQHQARVQGALLQHQLPDSRQCRDRRGAVAGG